MATEPRTSIVLATTHTKAELVELLIAQTEAAAAAQSQADEAIRLLRELIRDYTPEHIDVTSGSGTLGSRINAFLARREASDA